MFKSSKGATIFFGSFLLIIISFHWTDGYLQAKKTEDISFPVFVKKDTIENLNLYKETIKSIPDIIKEAVQSEDQLRIGLANKMSDILQVYQADHGRYPTSIQDITNTIKNEKKKEMLENFFTYQVKNNGAGFEINIKLKNGTVYKIEK